MNLQTIKSLGGKEEYVLIPVPVYRALRDEIEDELAGLEAWAAREDDYVSFDPADYVTNPITLARLRAGVKQVDLAKQMGVSQPYLSKLERTAHISSRVLGRVKEALYALQE